MVLGLEGEDLVGEVVDPVGSIALVLEMMQLLERQEVGEVVSQRLGWEQQGRAAQLFDLYLQRL